MIRIEATRITPSGRAWLTNFSRARPLHVFEHVCNLVNGEGIVLSLQSEPVPASPVSISLKTAQLFEGNSSGFANWLSRDSAVGVDEGSLSIGPLVIGWDRADLWDPAPDWQTMRAATGSWLARVPGLVPLLLEEAPPNSLAPLLAAEGSAAKVPPKGTLAARMLDTAREAADGVQRALREGDETGMARSAAALAGLGGGLTPSGDDYLMGVMHALWATEPEAVASGRSEVLAAAAIERTGPLSATWLSAAAGGEATGSWHQLLSALRSGDDVELRSIARRIMKIGHSSGADGLAGFCQTLLH